MNTGEQIELVLFFNGLSDRCFDDCVFNFKTRKLTQGEKSCVLKCTDKYMQAQQRMSKVYADEQLAMMKEMEAKEQKFQ